MTPHVSDEPPNNILADQIAKDLCDARIVPDNLRSELEAKLKGGGVTKDDWDKWIALAIADDTSEKTSDE